jgi:hypothetical protein
MTNEHLALVQSILCSALPKTSEVWIFGSRATKTVKPFSDLDLFIKSSEEINNAVLAQCAFALEESNLPYKVDLLDWSKINQNFQNIISNNPHFILFTVDF